MARHSSPRGRPTPLLSRVSSNLPVLPALPVLGSPALAGGPGPGAPRPVGGFTTAFAPRGASGSGGSLPGRVEEPVRALPDAVGSRAPGPRAASRPPRTNERATSGPGGALRGRLAIAAVAVGALASAGHGLADDLADGTPTTATDATTTAALALLAMAGAGTDTADPTPARSTAPSPRDTTSGAADAATTGVLPVTGPSATATASPTAAPATATEPAANTGQIGSLSKSRRLADAAAAEALAAATPDHVRPAEGRFTSGFGARWGTTHQGIDIANGIGTPIVSAADGTVVEAGPASGFGQWVRIRLDDGTINVYGHVNRFFVEAGQRVTAGERIAEIGNKGHSTGPHLHFEVWDTAGKKINPVPWFADHGISLGGGTGAAAD